MERWNQCKTFYYTYIIFILLFNRLILQYISGFRTMFLFAGNSLSISCNFSHSISLFYWVRFKTLLFKNSKTKMDTLHTKCSNSVISSCAHDKCYFQSNLCQFWHIHEIWWLGQTCGARNSSKFREITTFLIVLITCTLIIKKNIFW